MYSTYTLPDLVYIYCFRYLEDRFGKVARLTASLAFSIQMFLYMGIVLYAPSLALSAVTGLRYMSHWFG